MVTSYPRIVVLICGIMIGTLLSSLSYGAISTSVDRNRISENDILSLTIRSTDGPIEDKLDLSQLNLDFTVLNTQRSSQINIVNGKRDANYDLILVLAPKRTGRLRIPAFTVEGKSSQAIDIQVSAGQALPDQELSDVFLDNEVSTPEAYVQEQILYTLKIFHSVGLEDASISPLEVENAVVKKLGDQRKYESVLKGIRYSVIEIKYAIFPQRSGQITIPPQLFSGRTSSQFLGFRPYDSRRVRTRSATHIINVLPKPDSYPNNQPWLPTWKLDLQDSWGQNTPEFRVGEPVTRTISLTGRGLTAAQLPQLDLAAPEGFKVYPDKLQSDDVVTDDGILGQNSIATAFVPTKEGVAELPGFSVTWWNTQRNRLETTKVPTRSVRVLPSSVASLPTPTLPRQPSAIALDTSPSDAGQLTTSRWLWPISTAVMTLLWLSTLLLLWRNRGVVQETPADQSLDQASLRQSFRALQSACRDADPISARKALIHWYSLVAPEVPIKNLDDICRHVGDTALSTAISDLSIWLYGNPVDAQNWNGQALLKAVATINKQAKPKTKRVSGKKEQVLEPLYPM